MAGESEAPESEAPESEAPGQPAAHALMVDSLRRIAEWTYDENRYLGDRKARMMRSMLDTIPADVPVERQVGFYVQLALEEQRLGNPQAAVDHLSFANRLLQELPESLTGAMAGESDYYLAVAYMQLARAENSAPGAGASYILPMQGAGIHSRQQGSRKAIEHLRKALAATPGDAMMRVTARWLLNINYMFVGEYPEGVPIEQRISPEAFASDQEFPRFADIAPRLALDVFDLSGGAIVDDFNGDGLLDIVTSTWDTAGPMHYFRNDGDGSFSEIAAESGLTGIVGGLNLVQADYDNDGNTDILVLRGAWMGSTGRHPNSLLHNDGKGTFTDMTFDSGLGEVHYPTQTADWADYDNDGDLDLYVGNEATSTDRFPCQLFRNNGDGTFTDVALRAGVKNLRYAKAVAWGDYNSDRFPDLYVSNLQGENRLYRNNHDGTFTDVAPELGLTRPLDSFPTWFWDFDNDGILDLFVSSFYQGSPPQRLHAVAASYLGLPHPAELPRIYRGDGEGHFEEIGAKLNLNLVTMTMGSNFGDLDNDGFLDFYLGTGYPSYDALMPNVMYRNLRGKGFANVSSAGGFAHLQKGHSIAFADLDGDGDQEVFEQMGGATRGDGFRNVLYENPGFGNHWIKVKLVGVKSNRSAIGARIRVQVVEGGERRSIYKHVNSGGSFGANPLMQHLGLGKAEKIEVLEVFWPTSDLTQAFRDVSVDQALEITEDQDEYRALERRRTARND